MARLSSWIRCLSAWRWSKTVKLTLAKAKKLLQAEQMSLRKRDGEYRVNFKNGKEASAYYTNALDDAVLTGVYMRMRQRELISEGT